MSGHTVQTAQAKGWETLSNGALLTAAEEAGLELPLTTDRRIRHLCLPTDLPVARPARAPPLLAASEPQVHMYESTP